jgi:NAD-dependent DNA ligase
MNWQKKTAEELTQIHGLGEKTAEAIATFFATEENIELINKLKDIGMPYRVFIEPDLNNSKTA